MRASGGDWHPPEPFPTTCMRSALAMSTRLALGALALHRATLSTARAATASANEASSVSVSRSNECGHCGGAEQRRRSSDGTAVATAIKAACPALRLTQSQQATKPRLHPTTTPTICVQSPAQRPPRFYVPASLRGAGAGAILRLPADEARHAIKTLRLREGDRLDLCDGRGWVAQAELAGADKAGAVVHTVAAPVQVTPGCGHGQRWMAWAPAWLASHHSGGTPSSIATTPTTLCRCRSAAGSGTWRAPAAPSRAAAPTGWSRRRRSWGPLA